MHPRSMWSHPWTERRDSAFAYQARHVAEISGKTLLTPATATIDVMTDPVTWVCILEVSRVALEACAESACGCH